MAKHDIFSILKKEHDEVKTHLEELLDAIQGDKGTDVERLCDKLSTDLQVHMQVEEDIVYPELERIEDLESHVEEAFEEHSQLKKALNKLSDQKPDKETLREIQKLVTHHVREEEETVFPTARRIMDEKDYQSMSEEAANKRQSLKSSQTKK